MNIQDKLQREVSVEAEIRTPVLPLNVGTTLPNSTTPSVENVEFFKGSGAVVTIAKFKNGKEHQRLYILGDGTTTVDDNADIKTNTGAAKLLAVDKVYRFTGFILLGALVFYEDA